MTPKYDAGECGTPRCDAEPDSGYDYGDFVTRKFAKKLERDLIAAQAEIEALKHDIELHTNSMLTGASYPEIAAFLIACARVFQSNAEYDHAEHCLEAASDLYALA